MRRFVIRQRPDKVENQVRRQNFAATRIVYLTILSGTFLWLVNLLFGSYFYLRSEGLVLSPSVTIATEFTATVQRMDIREGERVTAGQHVASISSQPVTESIARLSSELATLTGKVADLRIEQGRNQAMTQIAAERSASASQTRARFETLLQRGFVPLDKKNAAVEADYRGQLDAEVLKAGQQTTSEQLSYLVPVLERQKMALEKLKDTYREGDVTAPMTGIVGRRYVEPGSVVRPGEPIADIYGGAAYVLSYVSTGARYTISPGDEVIVEWGLKATPGRVASIEPVAMELPKAFQSAFRPTPRNQVLRINLETEGEQPPLFSKVRVRRAGAVPWLLSWLG